VTGPDHYRLAEELLADRGMLDDVLVGVPRRTPPLRSPPPPRWRFRQPRRSRRMAPSRRYHSGQL